MPETNVTDELEVKITTPPKEPEKPKILSLGDYLKIDMDEEKRTMLAREILVQIDDILSKRGPRERQIKTFRNQYRQILEDSGYPFPGAYQVNVPITTKQVDTALSETSDIFEGADPKWTAQGTPSRLVQEAVKIQQDALDAYEDLIDQAFVSPRVFYDAWLLGTGWEARVFRRRYTEVMEERTWTSREQFIKEFPLQWQKHTDILTELDKGDPVKRVITFQQELLNAPISEHVEWEDAIVPKETQGLIGMRITPISARRIWMRWSEIALEENEGHYYADVSEELKHKVTKGTDGFMTRGDYNPDYMRDPIETFEVRYLMQLPEQMNEDGSVKSYKMVFCLINIARERELTMGCIRFPYSHSRPYLIPYHIQETESGIDQPGLGDKLQQINIGANALLQHVLNAGLIATSLSFKVRTNTDAVRAMFEKQWYPGSVTELSNLEDAQQWDFNMPNMEPMVRLFQLLLSFADEVSGISSSLSGEIDPEDPNAPGNKTALLLRRAAKRLRRYISTLRKSVDESGYQALRLIGQYVPTSKIAQILGIDPGEAEAAFSVRLPVLTHAAAFDVDRMEKQQADQTWFSLLMKEPLVSTSDIRRTKLLRILAETDNTGWDKRLDEVLPTEEELEQAAAAPPEPGGGGRTEAIISRVREKALASGLSPEQAEQMAQATVQRMTQMVAGRNGGAKGNGNGAPPGTDVAVQ